MTASPNIVSPENQSATFIELFFDLVFVFGITQVVGLLHSHITWSAVGGALLVFWLLWWAWTQFTWALNAANTDHPRIQLSVLFATAVAFFMAVAVPVSLDANPLLFAIPYVVVRSIGLYVFAWVASTNPEMSRAVRSFTIASLAGLVSVLIGAWMGGTALYWWWGATIVLDVIATLVGGRSTGWNLQPAHFVERHGLILIIALGESLIVAAGGLAGHELSNDLVAIGILTVSVTCAMWWAYFPHVRLRLEHALAEEPEDSTAQLARDAFSLTHFIMLFGVILFAAGVEIAIEHPHDPLSLEGRIGVAGGIALFLLGTTIAFRRAAGSWLVGRAGMTILLATGMMFVAWSPSVILGVAFATIIAIVLSEGALESRPANHG